MSTTATTSTRKMRRRAFVRRKGIAPAKTPKKNNKPKVPVATPKRPRKFVAVHVTKKTVIDAHVMYPKSVGFHKLGTQRSNTIDIPLNGSNVMAIAATALSYAMSKGLTNTGSARANLQVPYLAYVALVQMIESYVTGRANTLVLVPRWLAILGAHLVPRTVEVGYASFSLNWNYIDSYSGSLSYPTEVTANQAAVSKFVIHTIAAGLTAGYRQTTASSAYVVNNGPDAFTLLMNSMAGHDPMWQPVPFDSYYTNCHNKLNWFGNSQVTRGDGGMADSTSGLGNGAWEGVSWSEVPVTNYVGMTGTPTTGTFRSPKYAAVGGGDSAFHSALIYMSMGTWCEHKPIFKAIDIYEIIDLLSLWLVGVCQSGYESTTTAPTLLPANIGFTWQDWNLLIRSWLMYAFRDTQPMVQFINPRLSVSADDNLQTLVCGSNSFCSSDAARLLLPRVFIENIRSLQALSVVNVGNESLLYVPVLTASSFAQAASQAGTWAPIYTYGAGSAVSPFSATTAPTISLYDGFAGGSSYLQISDCLAVQANTNLFNTFIAQYKSYCTMELATLDSKTNGISKSVLCTTNVVVYPSTTRHMQNMENRKARKELREPVTLNHHYDSVMRTQSDSLRLLEIQKKDLVVNANPYATCYLNYVCSAKSMDRPIYTKYLVNFLKPVAQVSPDTTDLFNDSTASAYAYETYKDQKGVSQTYSTFPLSSFHASFAASMYGPAMSNPVQYEFDKL